MAEHTILLVDSDTALCERIQAALAPYGCRGVHLPDANEALTYPLVPSLIVLCIDPKRLGWASAMRIRKHPVLRNVPLVVTSAEATDKDFDEHKKLKTRADEYERKPLSVDRLVDKIRALLGGLEVQVSGEFDLPPSADSEELSLDDAVEIQPDDFEEDPSDRTRVGSMADIMHHETDAAFAQISVTAASHDENETTATHGPEGALAAGGMAMHSAPRMPQVPPAVLMAQAQMPHVAVVSPTSISHADLMLDPRTLSDDEDDAPADELSALRDERDRLLREVAEWKGKAVDRSPPGPAASREILSLREVINRKEKELLDVKDAFDTRDREIVNVRERLRESDKARRELDEKLLSVEKELISALEKNEAQARDKELAHDRERGFKGRLEDALKKLERAHAEIEEWKHRHGTDLDAAISAAATVSAKAEGDIQELRRGFDEERAGLAEAHEAAQAELMESHQREKAALLAVHADGHSAHAAEKARIVEAHEAEKARIVEAHEGEKAALVSTHEEGRRAAVAGVVEDKERLSARIAELESAVAGHEAAREKAAEAQAQALATERDAGSQAMQSLRAEHLAKIEEKEAAHRAALAEAERARLEMMQAHQAKLEETRAEMMQAHQAKIGEAERAREELMQAHQAKLGEAERARAEMMQKHQAKLGAAERAREELMQAHQERLGAAERAREELMQAHQERLEEAQAEKAQAVEALAATHAQMLEALVARHAEGSQALAAKAAELELSHASLVERHETERSERERLAEETAALREEAAQREARLSSLEAENAAFQEQILKAYHRLKTDEHVVARARKALAIALTLLDDTATTQDTKSS